MNQDLQLMEEGLVRLRIVFALGYNLIGISKTNLLGPINSPTYSDRQTKLKNIEEQNIKKYEEADLCLIRNGEKIFETIESVKKILHTDHFEFLQIPAIFDPMDLCEYLSPLGVKWDNENMETPNSYCSIIIYDGINHRNSKELQELGFKKRSFYSYLIAEALHMKRGLSPISGCTLSGKERQEAKKAIRSDIADKDFLEKVFF